MIAGNFSRDWNFMHKIKVYRTSQDHALINPLSVKREWMDNTWEAHAYHCFPVSLANKLGWGLSFPEDISFIWDGVSDSESSHVKILSGHKYAFSDRANATISFRTGLSFSSDEDITLMHMPVPNNFIDGVQSFTTLISSSWFAGEFPLACMITRPNTVITIKANTPIVAIIPINLAELNNSELIFDNIINKPSNNIDTIEYPKAISETNKAGKWTNFYRNATDHLGNIIGKHQVKKIDLHIKDN